jgi:hypothetical protein
MPPRKRARLPSILLAPVRFQNPNGDWISNSTVPRWCYNHPVPVDITGNTIDNWEPVITIDQARTTPYKAMIAAVIILVMEDHICVLNYAVRRQNRHFNICMS